MNIGVDENSFGKFHGYQNLKILDSSGVMDNSSFSFQREALREIGNLESFPGSTKHEINGFVEFFDEYQSNRKEKVTEETDIMDNLNK